MPGSPKPIRSDALWFLGEPSVSVTIVIVNWNSGEHLLNCLKHLARQSVRPSRILVVDNASFDGSIKAVEAQGDVSVLFSEVNLGFAGGNNRAFAEIDTEYIALLNPDAFPAPDWLEKLIEAAQKYPDIASFGSRQLRPGSDELLDGTGDVYHFSGAAWRSGFGRVCGDGDMIAKEIFSPCAAAAFYRRQMVDEVGGFDEDFFCYMEDVDLGFRLRLAGYGARYVPEAVVHHAGSATTGGQDSDFTVYHGHRNLVWIFVKNMPAGLGLPKMWRKRQNIQRHRLATAGEIWRVLDKRIILSRRNREGK